MYTKEQIEQFFKEHGTEMLSIESEPRKKKYNREVKVTVRCCVTGCNGTVTKKFRNHYNSKNFGCKEHTLGIKHQKTNATKQQNSRNRAINFDQTKEEDPVLIPNDYEKNEVDEEVINDIKIKDEERTHDSTILEATDLTEELKKQFFKKHNFFEYNTKRWTKANDVALFLEYREARNMIYHLVSEKDKISFKKFPENIQKEIQQLYVAAGTIHPETMFMNENGINRMINKSTKPVATGQKRKMEQVYVATTALYEKQGVYKIGKSVNSNKRISSMNTSRHPDDEMYLCHVAMCYNALKYEQLVHSKLEKYRVIPNREFFKLSLEEIISVVNNVCAKSK